MKTLLMLPKFHEKTLSRPGHIKVFRPGRRMYMYTLPLFMDVVLSEERQLMKLKNFVGGNFPGEKFSRRQFDGWEFPG